MVNRRASVCAVVIAALLTMPPQTRAGTLERFLGTWVNSSHDHTSCKNIEGEVAGFGVYRKKYIPLLGGFCEDLKYIERDNTLRISANCFSDEGGYSAVTNELELISENKLRLIETSEPEGRAEDEFFRCLDCGPDEEDCVFGGGEDQ